MDEKNFKIITFYEFKELTNLREIKNSLKSAMEEFSIFGTIIIAGEGFNSTICGIEKDLEKFIPIIENIFDTQIKYRASFHNECAFQRKKVKIKKEIVTLRKKVDIKKGIGTQIHSSEWNTILEDPEMIILDTRNDYEYKVGTFKGAINPQTNSFNELPEFIEKNLDPKIHKKIAMFCTGGIRCEKFAPYIKEKGFEEVYQLKGGILDYIENTSPEKSLWKGECFVFDERITVDENLEKGRQKDLSLETKK